ncbi:MAG: cobalt transport protein CbiN [Magnetococcales bacterium]|nr:cobalt transport protein CbiN [Magnetococcales bacterium]MBF0157053.1 cobalt transport protein CbiN [Magnetococcales bacterium]
MWRDNRILLGLALLVALLPFLLPWNQEATFTGADDQASALINRIQPDFHPWFTPPWDLPGAGFENLFWAIQAGLGSGILGYVIGVRHGRRRATEESSTRPGPDRPDPVEGSSSGGEKPTARRESPPHPRPPRQAAENARS